METIQIKVEREEYITGFYAYDEKQGVDFELVDGDWVSCGSPICHADTIQDAIDGLMETIQEERAAKADPKDENFVYEIPFKWS